MPRLALVFRTLKESSKQRVLELKIGHTVGMILSLKMAVFIFACYAGS